METNKFWYLVWTNAFILVVLLASICGVVTINSDNLKAEMVKEGADPIAVTCSMGNSQATICTILTTKDK